jgi:protein-disulfide isomerase
MGNREIVKKRRKQQASKDNRTAIIIIAALVIVIVGIVIATQVKPVGEIAASNHVYSVEYNGMSLGSPNAPVKVVEFADFQCPACANYWSVLEPTIIEQYVATGKVQYTYAPFSFLGRGQAWDESKKAAEAAYCANDQGMFWEYHDIIFANHNGENQGAYSKERLIAFAENLELDMNAFKSCFSSGKYEQAVEDANTFAASQGASYTPSFLIDGTIVNANELMQAIENSLAQ